MVLFRKVEFA